MAAAKAQPRLTGLPQEMSMLSKRRIFGLCACLACAAAAGAAKAAPASSGPADPLAGEARYAASAAEPTGGAGAAAAPAAARLAQVPPARAYAGSRRDGSGLPPLHHIGLVVRDRDRTLANLTSALGFGPTHTFEGYFGGLRLPSGHDGFGVRGGWVMMHNTAMEIVEPTDDHGPHAVYLKEHGEGLHHLAYWVASVRQELEAMARGGAEPRVVADATGPEQPVPWCYVEGALAGSTLVELIERNPISEQVYAEVFGAIGGKIPA
jgi:catechol 2,3-dioxygenase-like lactoylglutathione lyase family enzyme